MLDRVFRPPENTRDEAAEFLMTPCVPSPQSSSPATYTVEGTQYILVAINGGNYSSEFMSFRLP
jgi:hypothetical protein